MRLTTVDYFAFTIIRDEFICPVNGDIVSQLGGGGPQTVFGMRLWSDNVGLVAKVGKDLNGMPEILEDLQRLRCDQRGVRSNNCPTLRAYQKVDQEGQREQVWQVSSEVVRLQLGNIHEEIPEEYRKAKGIHLGVHPMAPDWELLSFLRGLPGLVSMETFRPPAKIMEQKSLIKLLSYADVFSPNISEASEMIGEGSPIELIRRFLDIGCKVIALRAGREGSYVGHQKTNDIYHIPAYPNKAINIIGAGNAYCGGFLTGLVDRKDMLEAGLRGAVSASLFIEKFGYPEIDEELKSKLEKRKTELKNKVETIQH